MVFETLLPSHLGRVAERSEVGRGSLTYCFLALFRKMAPENLFRQPFGLPPSPKGKARRCALQNFKHQFVEELSVLDFSQQAVLIKAGDADAFHLVMKALPLGPDADVVFRVAGA